LMLGSLIIFITHFIFNPPSFPSPMDRRTYLIIPLDIHKHTEVGTRNFFLSPQSQFRNLKETLPQSQFRNFLKQCCSATPQFRNQYCCTQKIQKKFVFKIVFNQFCPISHPRRIGKKS
jgi:hypothetical protein